MTTTTDTRTNNPGTHASPHSAKDYGVFTAGRALRTLWQQCEYTAPQELVEWVASHSADEAERQLLNLSEVVSGLGCLVMADDNGKGGAIAGNFRDGGDVGALLFTISSTIESLAVLAGIGSDAEYWQTRHEERARIAAMRAGER